MGHRRYDRRSRSPDTLQCAWIGLWQFGCVPVRSALKRLKGAGLIKMNDGIKLIGQTRVEVMTSGARIPAGRSLR